MISAAETANKKLYQCIVFQFFLRSNDSIPFNILNHFTAIGLKRLCAKELYTIMTHEVNRM